MVPLHYCDDDCLVVWTERTEFRRLVYEYGCVVSNGRGGVCNSRAPLMEYILTGVVLPFQVLLFSIGGWMLAMICLLPIIMLRDIIHDKLDGK